MHHILALLLSTTMALGIAAPLGAQPTATTTPRPPTHTGEGPTTPEQDQSPEPGHTRVRISVVMVNDHGNIQDFIHTYGRIGAVTIRDAQHDLYAVAHTTTTSSTIVIDLPDAGSPYSIRTHAHGVTCYSEWNLGIRRMVFVRCILGNRVWLPHAENGG